MCIKVIQHIKDDMGCANDCPMKNKSPYKISKCTCYKKDVIVEILRRSTENDNLKEELSKRRKFDNDIARLGMRAVTDSTTDEAEENGIADRLRGFIATARKLDIEFKGDM